MAQCNTSCSSVLSDCYETASRPKARAAAIQARIAALEENLSVAANVTRGSHPPQPFFEGRIIANDAQNVKPSSLRAAHLFKSAGIQTHTDVSGSSAPSHLKNVAMKSRVKRNTDVSSKTSVPPDSAKLTWINSRRQEAAKTLKLKNPQKSNVPSFPKVHQITRLSLAQQNEEQSLTDLSDRMEGIKAPKLPERQKPNHIRICGAQNKVQRENTNPSVPKKTNLPDLFNLGNPPPKPKRPPYVDIHPFIRNIKSQKDGPGMKTLHYATPPRTPPPLRLCPTSNHAAASSQQMDEDETYDDVGIMNPPPLPKEIMIWLFKIIHRPCCEQFHHKLSNIQEKAGISTDDLQNCNSHQNYREHPSKTREHADLGEDVYEELDDRWQEHQESNSAKDVTNHGKVTEEKQAGPNGTINSKEMKRKDVKSKKEEKKLQKQQKAKEKKREQETKKKTIKGPFQVIMKGKVLTDFKGGKLDLPLNQGDYDIYDDIGAPEEVCSGFTEQNFGEKYVYDDVDNPDTRLSSQTQPATVQNEVYNNVNSQNPPPPFDGCDIYYDDIKEAGIYENVRT